MPTNQEKLGFRRWLSIVLIGLVGQIAWAIENNYINLWVYSQSHNVDHIAWMTTASAIVATLTTFFIGALSDKLGKRKIFIAAGYTIWGVFVFLFGMMSKANMEALGGEANGLLLVGIMNVVVDCLMTFFGSTSNDACFNAFVTDETTEKNRPLVETVLSIMPLLSLVIMLLVGMAIGVPNASLSAEEVAPKWLIFFAVFGAITTLVGIASFFLLPKDHIDPNRDDNYFKHVFVGFLPKKIKEQPLFYIALLAFLFFNVGVDSFMPYFMVYFQNLPCFEGGNFYLGLGLILGAGSLLVLVFGFFLERIGKFKVLIPAVVLMAGGALGLYFAGDSFAWCLALGIVLISGYLIGTAALGATIRDYTPQSDVGAYQSVRMVFAVMLPMVIGSNLGKAFFSGERVNDYGQIEKAPDATMFLVAMVAALLAIAPIVWLILASKKKGAKPQKGN